MDLPKEWLAVLAVVSVLSPVLVALVSGLGRWNR